MTMKKILTLLLMTLTFATAKAQTDDEYRMEIGGGRRLRVVRGRLQSGSVLSNMQMGGSVVLRRIFNPYMGVKMAAMYGKLTGSSKDVKTILPRLRRQPLSPFSNTARRRHA